MLVKPCMYSPAGRPSSVRAAPAKNRKQSTVGGISSDFIAPSGLPTFSDSICASSSPAASMASASLSIISLRIRGVVSDQPSSNALRAAETARSTSSAVPLGTCAMTLPVAGLTISCASRPAPGVHSPPMNMSCLRSVVLMLSSISSGAERGAQNVQPFLQLLVGNRERHQRPDHVVVDAASQDDQALLASALEQGDRLLVRRLLGLPAAHELHAHHGADRADVADQLLVAGPALHPFFHHGADARRSLRQLLVAHDVHHRQARGAAH